MGRETLACRIGAGVSTSQSAWEAATEAAREARAGALGREEVGLAFIFLSRAHLADAESAVEAVRMELAPRHLLGCVAEGVVAGAREFEEGPAAAVWAGALPGAEIECFHAAIVQTHDGITVQGFPELDDPALVALLVDPFTFPVEPLQTRLNEDHAQIPLVGGIAVGGPGAGAQALLIDDGDFLMRGLLGADEQTGALALGDRVRVGQTLRFFVRDAASADADLRRALRSALSRARPAGALLFTCNGRGTNMFPEPDHDARLVAEALGTPALAGFFCGGELGPVGGKAFLHGFTATLAVFLEP
jgi:small ligand-binding sensory domain FIST